MINLTHSSEALSAHLTRLRILPLFVFVVLALMLVNDADARTRTSSRTVDTTTTETDGSLDTPYSDHGMSTKCTWENFQGTWEATPSDDSVVPAVPTTVTHFVGDKTVPHVSNLDYAVCGGFYTDSVPLESLTNPDGTPKAGLSDPTDPMYAPFGWGYFYFDITYESSVASTCTLDPNSGHGNSCGDDPDNTGSGGGKGKKNSGPTVDPASVACVPDADGAGTTLTYKFSCAAGVEVSGFLTLVPVIDDGAQSPPEFTQCGTDRVEAYQCTILYGGFPLNRKGSLDTNACLEAFPDSDVINGLDTTQYQHLGAGEVLLYQEVSHEGECLNDLPTVAGAAVAAYSRYCTSDIDMFTDNVEPNVFDLDPQFNWIHGFDNELRPCFKRKGSSNIHTGVQDVERIVLSEPIDADGPNSFNLNCSTGGNTDSGKVKVSITDQATLLAENIDVTPLTDAPTLEGVSPTKAVINTDDFGVDTLVLTYPTCNELTDNIIANNSLTSDDNNTDVTLELIGQANNGLEQIFNSLIEEVNVNGL